MISSWTAGSKVPKQALYPLPRATRSANTRDEKACTPESSQPNLATRWARYSPKMVARLLQGPLDWRNMGWRKRSPVSPSAWNRT